MEFKELKNNHKGVIIIPDIRETVYRIGNIKNRKDDILVSFIKSIDIDFLKLKKESLILDYINDFRSCLYTTLFQQDENGNYVYNILYGKKKNKVINDYNTDNIFSFDLYQMTYYLDNEKYFSPHFIKLLSYNFKINILLVEMKEYKMKVLNKTDINDEYDNYCVILKLNRDWIDFELVGVLSTNDEVQTIFDKKEINDLDFLEI